MAEIPSDLRKIQIEATRFRRPFGEHMSQQMGAAINANLDFRLFQISENAFVQDQIQKIIDIMAPVGCIYMSMLDLTTFQGQVDQLIPDSTNFVLANGASASGSKYSQLSGFASVPDLRGFFMRGQDPGGIIAPTGEWYFSYSGGLQPGAAPINSIQKPSILLHDHNITIPSVSYNENDYLYTDGVDANYGTTGGPPFNVQRIVSFSPIDRVLEPPPGSQPPLIHTNPYMRGYAFLSTIGNYVQPAPGEPTGPVETDPELRAIGDVRPKATTVNFFIRID